MISYENKYLIESDSKSINGYNIIVPWVYLLWSISASFDREFWADNAKFQVAIWFNYSSWIYDAVLQYASVNILKI